MKRLKLTLIGESSISVTVRVTEPQAELLKSISDDFQITHPEKYPILEVEEIE